MQEEALWHLMSLGLLVCLLLVIAIWMIFWEFNNESSRETPLLQLHRRAVRELMRDQQEQKAKLRAIENHVSQLQRQVLLLRDTVSRIHPGDAEWVLSERPRPIIG